MSDKPYYHEDDNEVALLRSWVLRQMLRGAGWAALVMGVLIAFFLVLKVISGLLPPESKEAPSPYSYLEQSVTGQVRVS
jgi:hypothetical protein